MKRAGATGGGGGPKPGGGKKIYARPEAIPIGEVMEDLFKKQWRIGKSIGVGGFGEIYLASNDATKSVNEKTAEYVMKIEPFMNGPLFVENSFYIRVAKSEMIQKWKTEHKLDSLGMPCFVTSGQHEYKSQHYRFMIIPRYGQDLQKIIESKAAKRLSIRSVQAIALQILDVLEYIHCKEYIHGDIKASNLLLGMGKKEQFFLVDYGLAAKFTNPAGQHFEYSPDNRKAHNGTLEYTSRDAHIGAFSRRGDLEILGYNMMEWLCGKLPWSNTDPPSHVHKQKAAFMNNIQLKKVYTLDIQGLEILEKYLKYVSGLTFDQTPNYNLCRELLRKDLPNKLTSLFLNDTFSPKKKRPPTKAQAQSSSSEELDEVVRKKIKVPEEDLSAQKRATRTTKKVKKNFNWTNVLSSNPERLIRSTSQTGGSHSPPDLKSLASTITGPLTPAMLQILAKKKENVLHSPLAPKGHHSSAQFHEGTSKLTPAMQEILMRTKKKKLRKSLSMNVLPTSPSHTLVSHQHPFTHQNHTSSKHNNIFAPAPKIVPLAPTKMVAPVASSSSTTPSPPLVIASTSRQERYTRRNN